MADEQINNDALANRSQYQQTNQDRDEEIVQVVYQSDQHGALVGVESTSLLGAVDPGEASLSTPTAAAALENSNYEQHAGDIGADSDGPAQIVHSHDSNEAGHGQPQGMTASASSLIGSYHEQLSRAASTLPPVAEEPLSSSGGSGPLGPVEPISHENSSPMNGGTNPLPADGSAGVGVGQSEPYAFSSDSSKELAGPAQLSSFAGLMQLNDQYSDIDQTTTTTTTTAQPQQQQPAAPIYSTIKRLARGQQQQQQQQQANYEQPHQQEQFAVDPYEATHGQQQQQQPIDAGCERNTNQQLENTKSLIDYSDEVDYQQQQQKPVTDEYEQQPVEDENCDPDKSVTRINQEIGHILTRQRAGAVEKGSFRNNFRKKLGLSVSTNENDLTAYRQKLLESSQDPNSLSVERYSDSAVATPVGNVSAGGHNQDPAGSLPSKFKRTHSVSFNVNSSRSNRHSVDIRNLPSYLTHKRASIVDVAKGAMSSIMSSLGGGGSGSGIGGGGGSGSGSAISIRERRESLAQADEEPIFEEPIAPTLSLGQRVAMVRSVGAEFGTVGWIGQFPDVDDDWIVGVIFDNMIGDCDGAYNGVRYFYSRENYAMFVPLSTLTKTDNYIGRPETGTMLSRMSVSLKPGQLISIQRSSIRLQHCFLNAPHQRVGHDVRAVSNRLHCQCHNCGPCAHLTKQQGRINALPHFGAHHLPHKSKNSLAHAAVEMLAHHHHHFHEEEEHDEKDYEFGDNAAHACNFVRYSCCPQSGARGHEFSRDCEMVRPELLDNLIHAPKAPHRRQTKPRRAPRGRRVNQQPRPCQMVGDKARQAALEGPGGNDGAPPYMGALEANSGNGADANEQQQPTDNELGNTQLVPSSVQAPDEGVGADQEDEEDGSDQSSYLSSQTSRSSRSGGGGSGSDSGSLSPRQSLDDGQPPAAPPYNFYTYDTSGFRPTGGVYNTINSQISFLDQQRFVYQRDSSAFMRSSAKPSHYSDDYYDTSTNYSEPQARREGGGRVSGSLGFKRILRCLGCLRQRGSQASGGRRRRRHRRKLSFRDRVLEYRRRQSTFVPSTLAKPHEDFASHGIMLPHSSGAGAGSGSRNPSAGNARHHQSQSRGGNGEVNSDYSSCSRSSCSSSRSNSPPNYTDTAAAAAYLNATIPMQTQDQQQQQQPTQRAHIEANRHVGTIEHEQSSAGYPYKSGQQQQQQPRSTQDGPANNCCRPQLDYGDFTFGDGYQSYEKHELSRDSALTDLCFTDTYKSNSSSDTLKHLVDQSINAQVSLPQPLPENIDDMISPLSSASTHRLEEHGDHQRQDSPHSGQYEISSPTASVTDNANADGTDADALDDDQENLRRDLQDFSLQETNEYRHDQASS